MSKIESLNKKIEATLYKINAHQKSIDTLKAEVKKLNEEKAAAETEELKAFIQKEKLTVSETIELLNSIRKGRKENEKKDESSNNTSAIY